LWKADDERGTGDLSPFVIGLSPTPGGWEIEKISSPKRRIMK
jgi:hypothetical protein